MVHQLIHPAGLRPLRQRSQAAFSLVELLVVLAIVAIFASVTMPSFQGAIQDYNLMDGGDRVMAALNLARQMALSENQTVEVRFYSHTSNSGRYDSIVSLIPSNSGTSPAWLTKPLFLPTGVVFATGNSAYSPMITATTGSSPVTGIDHSTASPQTLQGESYVAFHFRPDGSTDLDNTAWTGAWCLTLYNDHSRPGANSAPAANYITILLDPVVGRTRLYQPH